MRVTINGREVELAGPTPLLAYLESIGVDWRAVAVELNQEVIERAAYPSITIQAGDRLEVVRMVGGGRDRFRPGASPVPVAGPLIWHLAPRAAWPGGDHPRVAPTAEGFVHLSTSEQLLDTANRFYPGHRDLLALGVDPHRLGPELRWEPAAGDLRPGVFPHLYRALTAADVVVVFPVRPDADGVFRRQPGPATSGP